MQSIKVEKDLSIPAYFKQLFFFKMKQNLVLFELLTRRVIWNAFQRNILIRPEK